MALNSWQKITRVQPSQPFGNGTDGSYSSSTIPSLPRLSCSGTAGSTTLTVSSTTLGTGDLVIIHQSRGTGVGQWEINKVASGGGTTSLTMQVALQYTYTNSGASQPQVVKIPQYSSVTVPSATWTVPSWNQDTGGLFMFTCNGLTTINGTISAIGQSNNIGYRGGDGVGRNTTGHQGEGTLGDGAQTNTANGNGGGGGVGGADAGCGGGGGNGATGGTGSTQSGHAGGTGGSTSGASDLSTMTFGGGGGAGGGDEDGNYSGTGGWGGGIVGIFSKVLQMGATGHIYVYGGAGADGNNNIGTEGMGGGGGGAGGSILIAGQNVAMGADLLNLGGGAGGISPRRPQFIGGTGGAGRLAIYYASSLSGTVSTYGTYTSAQDSSFNTNANCFIIW